MIKQSIAALEYLTPQTRAKFREAVCMYIAQEGMYGVDRLPEKSKFPEISPEDYRRIRQMAVQECYNRRVAGQKWSTGKDVAFQSHNGGCKPSVILPHRTKQATT